MSKPRKLETTTASDLVKKVPPIAPPRLERVDLPPVTPPNPSTSFLDDLGLWFRNRLKRMATEEGGGIDAGALIPAISKFFSIGAFLAQWWIPLAALVLILVLLVVFKVL